MSALTGELARYGPAETLEKNIATLANSFSLKTVISACSKIP